jgi:hypothetical protein
MVVKVRVPSLADKVVAIDEEIKELKERRARLIAKIATARVGKYEGEYAVAAVFMRTPKKFNFQRAERLLGSAAYHKCWVLGDPLKSVRITALVDPIDDDDLEDE